MTGSAEPPFRVGLWVPDGGGQIQVELTVPRPGGGRPLVVHLHPILAAQIGKGMIAAGRAADDLDAHRAASAN